MAIIPWGCIHQPPAKFNAMKNRVRTGIGVTLVLCILIQVAILYPTTTTLNQASAPIDENVEFTIEPLFGATDADGKIAVTFHCQVVADHGDGRAEWFLIQGNMEIHSLEGGNGSEPCGDEWRLEPGTYRLNTFKTDGIRVEQSIEIHTMKAASDDLGGVALLFGLLAFARAKD